jgi:predicted PurR-regulated permease PerM
MNTEWRPTTKYVVGMGLAIFGIYLIYLSRSVLALIIIAALIAFLVRPIISFLFHRLKVPWRLAVLVTYLVATIVLLLAPLFLVPPIVNAVDFVLNLDYQALINSSFQWLENTLLSLKETDVQTLGIDINLDNLIDPMLASVQNAAPAITPELPSISAIINSLGSAFVVSYGVAVGVVGTAFSFAFMILAAIYFSLDAHRLYDWFLDTVPQAHRPEIVILLRRLRLVWEHFFRGQVILMVFIGTFVWLGGTALGLPGAFPLGIIAGLLEIIPSLGPFLAAIPGVIVALLQGSTYLAVNHFVFALIIILFYILVQAVENNFVVPRVLGEAVDLHPMVILVGVFVGATVWGILGALLAAPVMASGREIIRYLYLKTLGEEPFPPEEEESEATEISWTDSIKTLGTKVQQFILVRPASPPKPQETTPQNSEEGQN